MKRKIKLYFLLVIIIFSLFPIPQVKASTEYTFEGDALGAVPAGWTDSSSASCSARVSEDVAHESTKSVKIIDANSNGWAILDITSQFDETEISYWIYMYDTNRVLFIYTYEDGIGSDLLALVGFNDDGNVYAYNGGAMTKIVDNYILGQWYNIRIVFDLDADNFDVYIDDFLEADDYSFFGGVANSFKSCRFISGKGVNSGTMGYIDDVWIGEVEIDIEPPDDPNLLFGAGFNNSSPYVELHWNHTLIDVQLFEIQNSSDSVSWTYLGQSTTANYTDTQVVNGTYRYYKVRACNNTGAVWYNSSYSNIDLERVYFISEISNGNGEPSEDYAGLLIIGLVIGLILGIGSSRL